MKLFNRNKNNNSKEMAELQAKYNSVLKVLDNYRRQNEELIAENSELRAENRELSEKLYEAYDAHYDVYAEFEEYKEEAKDFMHQLKDKFEELQCELAETKEELEVSQEYVAELEEVLFEENENHPLVRDMAQYFGEKNAMDAVFRVYDEKLELPAPKAVVKKPVVKRPAKKPVKPITKKSVKTKATSKSGAKAVICITTGKIFTSLKEAAEFYGIKSSYSITKCCKGIQKSAGKHNGQKLEWQYA